VVTVAAAATSAEEPVIGRRFDRIFFGTRAGWISRVLGSRDSPLYAAIWDDGTASTVSEGPDTVIVPTPLSQLDDGSGRPAGPAAMRRARRTRRRMLRRQLREMRRPRDPPGFRQP
jgi:hypothetical protein